MPGRRLMYPVHGASAGIKICRTALAPKQSVTDCFTWNIMQGCAVFLHNLTGHCRVAGLCLSLIRRLL